MESNKQLDIINFKLVTQNADKDSSKISMDLVIHPKVLEIDAPNTTINVKDAALTVNVSEATITCGFIEDLESGARLTNMLYRKFGSYDDIINLADFEDGADLIADYIFEAILKLYVNKQCELEDYQVTACAEFIGFCHDLAAIIKKINEEEE